MNRYLLNLTKSDFIAQNRRPLPPRVIIPIVGLMLAAVTWAPSQAAVLPSGFSETVVTSDLINPTAMAFRARRSFVRLPAGRRPARDQKWCTVTNPIYIAVS